MLRILDPFEKLKNRFHSTGQGVSNYRISQEYIIILNKGEATMNQKRDQDVHYKEKFVHWIKSCKC